MKLLKLVPDDTNIKFLKLRVPFFVVSLLLIAASWALVFTKGLNYGVDFAGGQEIQVTFVGEEEAPVAEVRSTVSALDMVENPVIQRFGEANQASTIAIFHRLAPCFLWFEERAGRQRPEKFFAALSYRVRRSR